MIAEYGRQAAVRWLAGLNRNAQIYQTDESAVAAVNRGDVAAGLINHYYYYRLRAEMGSSSVHAKLAMFAAGDPGAVQDVSGAAIAGGEGGVPDDEIRAHGISFRAEDRRARLHPTGPSPVRGHAT